MLYYTSFQLPEFIALICAGMLMSAAALLLRAFRRLISAGRLLTLASDVTLGIIWAILFCAAITLAANGSLRLFHIIALAAGAALFHFALMLPLRRVCALTGSCAARICRRLARSRLCQTLFK